MILAKQKAMELRQGSDLLDSSQPTICCERYGDELPIGPSNGVVSNLTAPKNWWAGEKEA